MAKGKQVKPKESAEPDTSISPEPISAEMANPQPKIIIENYSKVSQYPDIQDFIQGYPLKKKPLLVRNDYKGEFLEIANGVSQILISNKTTELKPPPICFKDCADNSHANNLLHEFQAHNNKESKAFIFHNVAGNNSTNGGNIDLLHELRNEMLRGALSLVIIGLMEDVKDSDLPNGFLSFFEEVDLSSQDKLTKKMHGITNNRGRKPKHSKHGEFKKILDDILGDDKNATLGSYVKKVKKEMERENLKELRKVYCKGKKTDEQKIDLIYTDSTIKTYIQEHPLYKEIQKRKKKCKKV